MTEEMLKLIRKYADERECATMWRQINKNGRYYKVYLEQAARTYADIKEKLNETNDTETGDSSMGEVL
jgi:hypothetical protein